MALPVETMPERRPLRALPKIKRDHLAGGLIRREVGCGRSWAYISLGPADANRSYGFAGWWTFGGPRRVLSAGTLAGILFRDRGRLFEPSTHRSAVGRGEQ